MADQVELWSDNFLVRLQKLFSSLEFRVQSTNSTLKQYALELEAAMVVVNLDGMSANLESETL